MRESLQGKLSIGSEWEWLYFSDRVMSEVFPFPLLIIFCNAIFKLFFHKNLCLNIIFVIHNDQTDF